MEKSNLTVFLVYSFIILNGGDFSHMMDGWNMMDWLGFSSMWIWIIVIWIVFFVISIFVYMDAEKRNMNGLLWLILTIIPYIGILFLIIYLIIRENEAKNSSYNRTALDILDERYAKGEITREEYQKIKRDIKKGDE